MCCRYLVDLSPELKPFVEAMNRSPLLGRFPGGKAMTAAGEIRPTDIAPVIATGRNGERGVFPMKWGFALPGKAPLINARAETAGEKPMFREAWKAHRCIVPACGYYEWEHRTENGKKKTGQKYFLRPEGSGAVWMCGLYRIEEGLPVFVVLTREAGEGIRFIHDRMPLMLPEDRAREWIRPEAQPEEFLRFARTDIRPEQAG